VESKLYFGSLGMYFHRLFGPVFKWWFGTDSVVAVLQHDTIKSLLKHGDGKVSTHAACLYAP
jgi:hypothetical protein